MKRYATMSERRNRFNFCIKVDGVYHRIELEVPLDYETFKVYVNGEVDVEYKREAPIGGCILYVVEGEVID